MCPNWQFTQTCSLMAGSCPSGPNTILSASLRHTGASITGLVGTTLYAAPEVVRLGAGGKGAQTVTPLMDAFSVGVLLFELLTGQLPWSPATTASTTPSDLELAFNSYYHARVRNCQAKFGAVAHNLHASAATVHAIDECV